jgi:hypothetical protein
MLFLLQLISIMAVSSSIAKTRLCLQNVERHAEVNMQTYRSANCSCKPLHVSPNLSQHLNKRRERKSSKSHFEKSFNASLCYETVWQVILLQHSCICWETNRTFWDLGFLGHLWRLMSYEIWCRKCAGVSEEPVAFFHCGIFVYVYGRIYVTLQRTTIWRK